MTRVAQALAIVVLAAVLGACGGSGGGVVGGEPISFEQLTRAARSSAEATSGRFAFALEVSAPERERTLRFSGEGAFDEASGRAAFSADLSSFIELLGGLFAGFAGVDGAPDFDDPSLWRIETIRDRTVTYLRFPALDDRLPDGKAWVRLDDGESAKAGGLELREFDRFTQADPQELLELLRAVSGDLETIGTEKLRGTDTTHYRASLDPGSLSQAAGVGDGEDFGTLADELVAQSGVSEIPLDLWVDADGLVRKLAFEVTSTEAGSSEPSEASISFELWGFGEPVDVELPPASQVVDASALER